MNSIYYIYIYIDLYFYICLKTDKWISLENNKWASIPPQLLQKWKWEVEGKRGEETSIFTYFEVGELT